jgi:AbrB family looped-hinge helix DNA binding protein
MSAVDSSTVTVSAKGWVVIPSLLRRKIGLKPGMKVSVTEVDGKIVLTPQIEDPVDALYGRLAGGESLTAALLNAKAEDRGRENKKFHSR